MMTTTTTEQDHHGNHFREKKMFAQCVRVPVVYVFRGFGATTSNFHICATPRRDRMVHSIYYTGNVTGIYTREKMSPENFSYISEFYTYFSFLEFWFFVATVG